ncbi:MAG: hypothetical protein LQ352_004797 [Teloschistes flavicans]|nr:MAG: hypothetical protein LQ352_004797 [Teloschistes flavicans]
MAETLNDTNEAHGFTTLPTRSELALSLTALKLKQLPESASHNDLLAVLSAVQEHEVNVLPLVWYPSLSLGQGGFALVNESPVNQHESFAFKRLKVQGDDTDEQRQSFEGAIKELAILTDLDIAREANIVTIEGICWEVNPLNPYISPVLVFEKAHYGNLSIFRDSGRWEQVPLEGRLTIWKQIAGACRVLHEKHIIHGDIKPENILVFADVNGAPLVKVTDFGHSAFGQSERDMCYPPASNFWAAPEYHHRGFSIASAKLMEIYTLSLLCLWLLLDQHHGVLKGADAVRILWKAIDQGSLTELAFEVVQSLQMAERRSEELKEFFASSLRTDPSKRTSSVHKILNFFGIGIDQEMAKHWLDRGDYEQDDLEDDRDEITDMVIYRSQKVKTLRLDGFSMIMDHVNEYRQPDYNISAIQAFYRREIDDLTRWLPEHPLITVTPRAILASVLHGVGNFRDAEEVYRELLVFYEQWSDNWKDNDYSRCKISLAQVLREQGRLPEAEAINRIALAERRKLQNGEIDNNPVTVECMASLGSILHEEKKWEEATSIFRQTLMASQTIFGRSHPRTLSAMTNLACACRESNLLEAEYLDKTTLQIKSEVLDDGEQIHYSTVSSMANLALTYSRQGRLKEAEELEVRVLELRMKNCSSDDPAVLKAMGNLGLTYYYQGRYKEAEMLQSKSVKGRMHILAPNHPQTLEIIDQLADTYDSLGRLADAGNLRTYGQLPSQL